MERELDRNNTALDEAEREMDDAADAADDLEEEIDDAGDAADDSEGKFSKLGSTLKTVGVAMGAVVTAAAAAAVSLGKAVVEAYGEYEQLVGGIDTLFKDSSASLQECRQTTICPRSLLFLHPLFLLSVVILRRQ